ncbi:MAG: S9 family peptidase [Ardenticatenaceae bacterium]|nr:S9 family peptidase [Ardenticatenaceae bacterium]
MTTTQTAPYGAWRSPITSDLIVAQTINLGSVCVDGQDIYWLEGRPQEGGRSVLVHRTPAGQIGDVTPAGFNVRTRVHEYGGGAFWVAGGVVYFANFADQRLYRQLPGTDPSPITPAGAWRYADGVLDAARQRLICVREDHTVPGREAVNTLVSLALDGDEHAGDLLVGGHDFYANPRLSPDGRQLAWLAWNHPNMPWDGTELWLADVDPAGQLHNAHIVAGGPEESIFQPAWSPDGRLHFISDRSGWWNLYRWHAGQAQPLAPRAAEFGLPMWVFDMSTYDFLPDGRLVCSFASEGRRQLALLEVDGGPLVPIDLPYTLSAYIHAGPGFVACLAGSATEMLAVVRLDLATGALDVLRRASDLTLATGYLSVPQAIEFPTDHGLTAHGLYYAPHNQDYRAPAGELPPLMVISHGGPTSSTSAALSLSIQYWTSRGFAVLDVNYGGSTGYGRAYRQRLNGQWGIVDVQDCVNGARYLVQQGLADGQRLAIRGGSAGGYTTLSALAFTDTFSVGASYFGISDLVAMTRETHKFESRYLDNLVAPYPEREDIYFARSPINFVDQFSCPLILFQGLEDLIVPPNQAEMIFDALKAKGVPVAYVPFAGEQHGFRRAENVKRALDAELYFYGRIFGFPLADPVEPVAIENLSQ